MEQQEGKWELLELAAAGLELETRARKCWAGLSWARQTGAKTNNQGQLSLAAGCQNDPKAGG